MGDFRNTHLYFLSTFFLITPNLSVTYNAKTSPNYLGYNIFYSI